MLPAKCLRSSFSLSLKGSDTFCKAVVRVKAEDIDFSTEPSVDLIFLPFKMCYPYLYVCVCHVCVHMCVSCLWTAEEEESVECPGPAGSRDLPSVCARN